MKLTTHFRHAGWQAPPAPRRGRCSAVVCVLDGAGNCRAGRPPSAVARVRSLRSSRSAAVAPGCKPQGAAARGTQAAERTDPESDHPGQMEGIAAPELKPMGISPSSRRPPPTAKPQTEAGSPPQVPSRLTGR